MKAEPGPISLTVPREVASGLMTEESSVRFSFSDLRHIPNSGISSPRGVRDLNQTNTFSSTGHRFLKRRSEFRFDLAMYEVLRKQFQKKSYKGRMS